MDGGGEEGGESTRLRRALEREREARAEAEGIAERAIRELYERGTELELVGAVAAAANQAVSIMPALAEVLRLVGLHAGWAVAHAYLVAEETQRLHSTGLWYLDDDDALRAFRDTTEASGYLPGEGMPGRVLSSRGPVWVPDIPADPTFLRKEACAQAGLNSAFAVPILIGEVPVGVMEFLRRGTTERDDRLLGVMAQVGTQLGRVVERDRATAELEALARRLAAGNAQLEATNHALDAFASAVSHDLSEPLRTARGYLELVSASAGLDEQARSHLDQATGALGGMREMIVGMLDYARAGEEVRVRHDVDVRDALRRALDNLAERVTATGVEVSTSPDLPTVTADPDGLTRVLQNLISNALKFRRDGVVPEVQITVRADQEGGWRFEVADNGIGIPPDQAERIFEMFARAPGSEEVDGTGIGLAICARIVEAHGGRMWARPRDGGGAVLGFSLRG